MAYIGNNPDAIQTTIEITRFNGDAACTQFQIPQDVDDAKAIEVLVNSVQQDPDNSYSVTNGLITFSEAPSAGTNNVTVLRRTGITFTRTQIDSGDILPNAVTTIAIANNSITSDKIAPGTVIASDIADGSITGPKLGANSVSSNNIISGLALTGNVSVTGNVTVGAGTVTNPSLTTTGDTNTGIFFPTADTIAFSEGGVESVRIDSSGNVGIGNTSPAEKLSVIVDSDSALTSCSLRNLNAGASAAGRLVVGNDISNSAGLIFGSSTNSIFGANTLVLYQNNAAPVTIWTSNTERMRITSDGQLFVNNTTNIISGALDNVQIGCTAPSSSIQYGMMIGGNGTGFTVNAIRFVNTYTPAVVGTITIGSSSTAYNTSSDYRLKENIAPMTGALNKVAQLKPVTYTWKADNSNGEGFIAHELQEFAPYAVSGEKDGEQMQGVDYGKITPLLTAALQEALAKIELLEVRLAVLESK